MAALFSTSELDKEENNTADKSAESIHHIPHHLLRVGSKKQKMEDVIGEIQMGNTIHFKTAGEWSCHELVSYILSITGAVDLLITSYAISEFEARMLSLMGEQGLIKSLHCIMDKRADQRTPGSMQLLKNIGKVIMAHCHAKVTVLINNEWAIAIVGSANWTSNPRIEASVICCDFTVANFYKEWILKEFENAD